MQRLFREEGEDMYSIKHSMLSKSICLFPTLLELIVLYQNDK